MKKLFNKFFSTLIVTFMMVSTIIQPVVATTFYDDVIIRGRTVLQSGFQPKVTNTATTYTALRTDHLIRVTSTAAARTINLFTAVNNCGAEIIVKDASGAAGTNNITIDGFGAQTIDNSATKVIAVNFGYIALRSNCTNWNVLGTNTATSGSGDATVGGTNSFTGNNSFATGTFTLSNGGSLTGTFTGNPTFSGAPVLSGAASFTGSPTFATGTPVFNNGFTLTGTVTGTHTDSGTATHSGTNSFTGLTKVKVPVTTTSATAVNSTGAITAAQLAGGLITSTSAAAVTATLPTATLLATALGSVGQGASFEFVVDNTAGASTVTVAVNTGIIAATPVITGGATLTVAASATQGVGVFKIVFTSATTAVLFRIG